jgi:hypothetical protein
MADKNKQAPATDPYASIAESDPYAGIAESSAPSVDTLTANPKKQGTYRMVPPSGSEVKSGIMIPYGNIKAAREQGFAFDPTSGDDTRYAHDLFTELQGKGKAPTVESDDEQNVQDYGVVPTPAPGSKEYMKRGAVKAAHGATDSLPTIGSMGGALLTGVPGAATGPLDLAIAAGGAAAGGAAGETAKQGINHFLFGENQTPGERAKNIGKQALLGGASEVGGRVIAMPLGAAARYFGFAADESAKAGVRLLPSEAAGKAPTWLEEFLKGSVLSKGIMDKFREAQNKESLAAANKLMDSVSSFKGTPEQLGLMVQKGLEDSEAALRAEQNMLYGALDNVTEQVVTPATTKLAPVIKNGVPVRNASGKVVMQTVQVPEKTRVMPSMLELKRFAQEQLDKINKPPYFLPPDAAEKARGAFNTILQNPNEVSFKRMRDMRSVLLSQVRDLDEVMGGGKLGLAKKFTELSDKALEDAADKSGIPGLKQRWREANAVTAEGHQMFEQKLVEKAAESENPEFIASLLGGKTIGLQQTRDLFKALPQKLHDPVRRGLLQDAVAKATERSGAFDEGKFANYVYKLGDERGQIIFGSNWKNVKELSELVGRINGPVGLGGGGGASLQNVGIMKKLLSGGIGIAAAVPVAAGIGNGHYESGLAAGALIGLGGVATEGAVARSFAWAMVNPAKAAKMLTMARGIASKLPYLPPVAYNMTKRMSPEYYKKFNGYVQKSKDDLTKSAVPGPQSSITPPVSPAAQGQVAYAHTAVNPETGHRVVSRDGRIWIDPNTGQQVG